VTRPHTIGVVGVSIFVFLLVFCVVWGRTSPIVGLGGEIAPPVVEPGGTIKVIRHLKILRTDCTGVDVDATIVDSRGIVHTIFTKSLPPPILQPETSRKWPIPKTMPSGPAQYRSKVSFDCFPFYSWWPIIIEPPELPVLAFEVK
jgi:hypothetical protein